MSYGDFTAQIKGRGAIDVLRSAEDKTTCFVYQGKLWQCPDRNRSIMSQELADGYEMDYCLANYCEPGPVPG